MYHISSFYKFSPLSEQQLQDLEKQLEVAFSENLLGLILIASEGINATIGSKELNTIESFMAVIGKFLPTSDIIFKLSTSEKPPFKRFKISVREEIITYDGEPKIPAPSKKSYLTPTEWHEILEKEKDNIVLIDTRNDYELACGKFDGAIDPEIRTFTEFKEYYKKNPFPKDKKVLMYCTGGVRCEKTVFDLESQGYDNVYHLKGGILKYMEEFPDGHFKGECFVFDHRVSINKEMEPSKIFSLCPHCGNAGSKKIACKKCKKESVICESCFESCETHISCSRNCAYYLKTHMPNEVDVVTN